MRGFNPRKNQRYKWGKYWRQRGHVRKGLVEDCVAIINVSMIRYEKYSVGEHVMLQPGTDAAIGHVFLRREGFSLEAVHDGERQVFTLTETPTRFNGWLLWLTCPVCHKRANKLYKPAGKQFACRGCHQLTYRTCQQHKCGQGGSLNGYAVHETWRRVNQQLVAAGCSPVEIPHYIRKGAGLISDKTGILPPVVIKIGRLSFTIPRE